VGLILKENTMVELTKQQILEIIKAMRLSYLIKYLGADPNNITIELIEKMNLDFINGLCAVFAIALNCVIPSARYCKFDGIFGNHVFVRIGDYFYDGNGLFNPGDDRFNLWNSDERYFDVYEYDIQDFMPKNYYSDIKVRKYYDDMIDALTKRGREVLASYLKKKENKKMLLRDFLRKIDYLQLPVGEYYISGESALLCYGIRKDINNINLCISAELYKWLCKTHSVELEENICPSYLIDGQIKCIVKDHKDFEFEMIYGYPVESLASILKFKRQRNLPHDIVDISIIESYLKDKQSIRKA